MMALLLSSVSSSALISGGGGGYPTAMEAYLVDHDNSSVDNYEPTLNFPLTGKYLVSLYGASGGIAGDDSPITITGVGTESFVQVAHAESDDYEEVTYAIVDVVNTGSHSISYTASGTSYRRGALNWKISDLVDTNTSVFYPALGRGLTHEIPVNAGGFLFATMASRGGTLGLTGTGLIEDVPSLAYDSTDVMAAYSKPITTTETTSIADNSPATVSTRLITAFMILYLKEEFVYVDASRLMTVLGNPVDRVTASFQRTMLVHGNRVDGISMPYNQTFVILE